ncbi:hypothetical protein D9M69_559200 [compost metagenome]
MYEHGLKLGSLGVFAAGLVREGPVNGDAVQLAGFVLAGAADADIADRLACWGLLGAGGAGVHGQRAYG